ncbi:MAG: hypothetical protein M3Q07_13315 [Pseudobdellovibrionaceae bacterium]|nr:hypothetical protein [Pseudobdellovibrionaceae bacterium]
MNQDLKTRLFSSVIFSPSREPGLIGPSRAKGPSLGQFFFTLGALAAAAGLILLLIAKVKPLL